MKKLLAITLILCLAVSFAGCAVSSPSFNDLLGIQGPDVTRPPESEQTEPATTAPVETEPTDPTVADYNPYYDCWVTYNDYVLVNSDTVYYGRSSLAVFSDEELEIAKQEMYARHGRTFTDPYLEEYFTARSWYTPGTETELNACEKANLFLLQNYAREQSGEINSNRYIRHMTSASGFVMADSNSRYLRASDLSTLELDQLVVIRNEIYARQGYIFDSDELKGYFYCTDWYVPNPGFTKKSFNKYEEANITLCSLYERKLEGVKFSSKNKYKSYYDGPNTVICSTSSNSYLTEDYLWMLTDEQLVLVRNEILARNGYTFTNKDMQEFFLQCDWYTPDTPPGDTSPLELNNVEEYNRNLVKEHEAYRKSIR